MSRRELGMLIDKAFWYLLVGVISYGVKSLHELSSSVSELNAKIAVVIDQQSHQGEELREHASRIHDIELEIIKGNDHGRPTAQ